MHVFSFQNVAEKNERCGGWAIPSGIVCLVLLGSNTTRRAGSTIKRCQYGIAVKREKELL